MAIKVKKLDDKMQAAWNEVLEWAINQTKHEVSYHNIDGQEIDLWLQDDSGRHIKLMPNGTWTLE